MNARSFFSELKRRRVYNVAVAYVVAAWLLVQVATQVFPFFNIPNWVVRLVVLLTIVGFPVSLVCAWAFEMTPEGIKLEGAIHRGTTRQLRGLGAGSDVLSVLHFAESQRSRETTAIHSCHRKQIGRRPAF